MAAVPRALFSVPAVLSISAAVPTAVFESALLSDQRSGANAGVETAGASPKQRNTSQVLYFRPRW